MRLLVLVVSLIVSVNVFASGKSTCPGALMKTFGGPARKAITVASDNSQDDVGPRSTVRARQ